MKWNFSSIFLVLLSSLLLQSCGEDAFTQIVEIDLPEHTPMLSVNANYKMGSDSLIVKVGKTASTTTLNAHEQPENVQIELYGNGVLVPATVTPAMTQDIPPPYCPYCPSGIRHAVMHFAEPLQQGATYELRVQASNLQTVSTIQIAPDNPAFDNMAYHPNSIVSPNWYDYGGKLDEITLDLADAANEENYYLFQVFQRIKDCNPDYGQYCDHEYIIDDIDSYQPNMEQINGGIIITSDVVFDGKTRSVQLITRPLDTLYYRSFVVVGQITQDYYKYLLSFQRYSETNDNFLAEPVNLFTNVENGVGCFAISNYQTIPIQ